ncbi:MAG TPA: WD40 repeat domain-containing protein, partial [Armatimonadota bacterium]|nr:WD40 repeat domain-containing protein [Armatimonadota bacterium]
LKSPRVRLRRPGHSGYSPVAFSPDGKLLAAGTGEGAIRLCNPGSGALIRTIAWPHQVINSLAFTPDSNVLAVGGLSRISLWRVRTGELLRD